MPSSSKKSRRRVRDGILKSLDSVSFASAISDEALLWLAQARNAASKTANTFMLIGALISVLYFLRLQGIADELKVGDYKLSSIPYGLFVFSFFYISISTVSLLRFGDSRAYDRQLKLACEQHYECDCELRYMIFPNDHGWGEPLSRMVYVVDAGFIFGAFRFVSLILLNVFLLGLSLAPIATGLDFLYSARWTIDVTLHEAQRASIGFLVIANVATFLLVSWARIIDRD